MDWTAVRWLVLCKSPPSWWAWVSFAWGDISAWRHYGMGGRNQSLPISACVLWGLVTSLRLLAAWRIFSALAAIITRRYRYLVSTSKLVSWQENWGLQLVFYCWSRS